MGEAAAFDDALCWIVVDVDALQLGEERVAVAQALADPAGALRRGQRALRAILAQRVRARPFGRRAVGPALGSRARARWRESSAASIDAPPPGS